MKLYEVRNGFTGESYVRVYVWAPDEQMAREMASEAFRKESDKRSSPYSESYWTNLEVEELFSASRLRFVTKPSDAGWETE